jgi:hypothetical protein
MKKLLVFFGLLALLVSCSTNVSRNISIRGFSYTEGMEDDNWRLIVKYNAHGFEEVVLEENIDVLEVERVSIYIFFIAKITLSSEDYRFLISIMLDENLRFEIENSDEVNHGVWVSFISENVD